MLVCWTHDWQTGKSSFVEHRTFLHLYRSFHRLWIFLALMFQVPFSNHQFTLKSELWLVINSSLKYVYSFTSQALTIIAFNHGHINLNTFKTVLSIGPSFAIMNFIKSKMISLFLLYWVASNSQNTNFMVNRLLGCVTHIWVIQNCKGHGCFKASNKVFLGWLDFCICNICLPVSFWFSLRYFVC